MLCQYKIIFYNTAKQYPSQITFIEYIYFFIFSFEITIFPQLIPHFISLFFPVYFHLITTENHTARLWLSPNTNPSGNLSISIFSTESYILRSGPRYPFLIFSIKYFRTAYLSAHLVSQGSRTYSLNHCSFLLKVLKFSKF